jgi:hypothetical protein
MPSARTFLGFHHYSDRLLGAVFGRWAADQRVQCVVDLLSQQYRAALDNLDPVRRTGIQRIAIDYPGRFQASNRDRGVDLKELLILNASISA